MSTFARDYRKTVPAPATGPDTGLFLLFSHAETLPRAINDEFAIRACHSYLS